MIKIPCTESGCKEMLDSALDLKIHRYELHKIILSESDRKLLSRWIDVK